MKKKTAMLISFAVGTLMFTTTALAEVAAKSGYDQAKDVMKYSAEAFTSKLSNYTVDISFALKDNGNIVTSQNSVNKYDLKKNACENVTTTVDGNTKTDSIFYRDKNTTISYNSNQGVYYINDHQNTDEQFWIKNPFKEKEAGDLEKIADAFIGNLKDYVTVSQNSDGSKELSGSINEAQIPSLVNALVSFQFKRQFGYYTNNPNDKSVMPKITQDIYVKEVKGKMSVDKNGLAESVFGTGVLCGKDDKGTEHNLTFEMLAKVSNVGSTAVNKPDLTGKKVEKTVNADKGNTTNTQAYLGTYKSNIIIMKDDKFQKVGEKFIEIEQIDDKTVTGKYYEKLDKGFEKYASQVKEFKLDAKFNNYPYGGEFQFTNEQGKIIRGNLSLNPMLAKIYMDFEDTQYRIPADSVEGRVIYDPEFERVFN